VEAMKIILWNVHNGFRGSNNGLYKGSTRESLIADQLAEQKPDVVGLLELQGFDNNKLATLAHRWDHKHYYLITGKFPMAITSRYPLFRPIWNSTGMLHGFISVKIRHIRILLCHIPPEKYGNRKSELRILLHHLLPVLDNADPILLLGDLNSTYHDDVATTFRAIGFSDSLSEDKSRVDYILHSGIEEDVKVIWKRNKEMGRLSDHFPLIATLSPIEE
jgi:endonuclease/exonuclease/phosphatase family metal-dependent hydrolase